MKAGPISASSAVETPRDRSSIGPRRCLGTLDSLVLVVGLVIGVGIFRAPQLVAANAEGAAVFMGLWVLGGLISLVGALCYAELATAYPNAGGEYHFLSRAFGLPFGFLFAWSRMTVIQTGSIAILAFVFGDYAGSLLGFSEEASPLLATAAVVVLTALNAAGLRQGRRTQYVLTVVEVTGLVAVILAGLLLTTPAGAEAPGATGASLSTSHVGLAMVFVLLTFGGWSEAAYLSAEVRDARRGIMWTLLGGIGILTLLYVLANTAYLRSLGLAGMAESTVVAADVMRLSAGAWGAGALSLIVMVSALSSANATIITGARSNYALGRDFRLFALLGAWSDRAATPTHAVLVQGLIALLLVAFGSVTRSGFESMVAYTAPVFWLILLLTGVSLFVLRTRDPGRKRLFRVPLYPLTPLLFCAASAFMLYSSVAYAGGGAILGLIVMLAGLPLLLVARWKAPRALAESDSLQPLP